MEFKARSIALILAPAISLSATALFLAFGLITLRGVLPAVLITVIIAFAFNYFFLERRVFRSLNKWVKLAGTLKGESEGEPDRPLVADERLLKLLEQKEQEIDELRKLEEFRKDFIADVGHELKTPIFAAQGFVHTLLDGAVKDKSVRKKFLKKAAKSLDGLDRLVHDLVTLSQIETGKVKMQFGHFDLYDLAEDVLDQFEEKAEKKSVDLRIEGSKRLIVVYADMERIRQVLNNLVSNAINYTPPGGSIRVAFKATSRSVITHVRDTGVGIPGEHVDRVFQRFYRVDKSRNRERGGTGLGLAIVKHILEGHGTKAEIVSEPGKGSDFSFKLPRQVEAADTESI